MLWYVFLVFVECSSVKQAICVPRWLTPKEAAEYLRMGSAAVQDLDPRVELLGHKDVKTTMVYTRVLNRGPAGVRSPIDEL